MRIDLEPPPGRRDSPVWTAGPGKYAGAPIFVPRPRGAKGEQDEESTPSDVDGYILTYVYDAERHTTQAVVLDAGDIEAGPVVVLQLPTHLPLSFHGLFAAE